ncbi:NAD-dependent epimerase/dehydratase family protein [Amylibacter sp.]|nr:NAD-dependent epimerase/dehydratase family protein [Amylibacter sp.]
MLLTNSFSLPQEDVDSVVSEVGDSWENLRNKSLLLTGGTGFIGKWLIETLIHANQQLSLNCNVTIPSRNPKEFFRKHPRILQCPRLNIVKVDLSHDQKVITGPYDFVIHGASDVIIRKQPKEEFHDIIRSTQFVLDVSSSTNADCKFLLLSSGAVYGLAPPGEHYFKETHKSSLQMNNVQQAYAEGKRISEILCAFEANANNRFHYNIARCFSFVGPYLSLNKQFAIGNFINDVLNDREICVNGDGTTLRSYQYASDLCTQLWKILLEGKSGETFNVGCDQAVSIRQLAEETIIALNSPVGSKILGAQKCGSMPLSYLPNIDKITDTFNYQNKINLRQAITKTASWHIIRQKHLADWS